MLRNAFSNFRANRASSALTALFLLLALASVALMRGHTASSINPDPKQPGNGGNNDQETPDDMLTPPSDWESWVPTAALGKEDPVTIAFTATVDASDTGSVEFEFLYVTSYEGRYMNDAEKEDDYSADLYFAKCKDQAPITDANGKKVGTWSSGGIDSTSITASWTEKPSTNADDKIEIPVKIVCNDFAAYGTIQATLRAEGKKSESGIHKIPKDDEPLIWRRKPGGTIPARGNKIADAWDAQDAHKTDLVTGKPPILLPWRDRDYGGKIQNSVHETSETWYPHGRNNGDGFSVLEEYRGFMVGGSYTRLNPPRQGRLHRLQFGSRRLNR